MVCVYCIWRSPRIRRRWPKRAWSKYSLTARVCGKVTTMDSTASKVASAVVDPSAGSSICVAAGRALPLLSIVMEPLAVLTATWVTSWNSPTTPSTVTASPTAIPGTSCAQ